MIDPKDPSDFRRMLVEAPDQFKEGLKLAKDIKIDGEFRQVVISGMGGSSWPSNLFRTYLNSAFGKLKEKPTPIYQNRFYTLPPEAHDVGTINLICSYSGTTEEVISSFKEVIECKLPCIGLSSGGDIEEICKANNIPHVKFPIPYPNFQPRAATGYIFSAILQLFINHNLAPDETPKLLSLMETLQGEVPGLEEKGKEIAKKIFGKTPIIYSSVTYKSVAHVWKIKLNENSKTPAFWNFFPELNHNEMIGFTNPQAKFYIIMLRDPNDHPKNLNRYEATSELLTKNGIDVEIIDMQGEEVFYKIFHTLTLGDFISYYLALEYGQDPTPVEMVEKLKKILSEMS